MNLINANILKLVSAGILSISIILIFYIGESGEKLFTNLTISIIVINGIVISFLKFKPIFTRLFIFFIILFFLTIILFLGNYSHSKAFNNCFVEGEKVREKLEDYYISNGNYPDSLKIISMQNSCSRLLRGSILNYKKTQDGYSLIFSDWLVEQFATQSESFRGQK